MKTLNFKSLLTVLAVLFSISAINAQEDWPCTVIEVNGDGYTDKVWIFAGPGTTTGFDNGYDGRKFLSTTTPAPQIYYIGSDGNYQISASETFDNTLLGFIPGIATNFTLTFTHYNLAPTYEHLYLIDHVADTIVDVYAQASTYSFTASPDDIVERFSLISYLDTAIDNNGEIDETEDAVIDDKTTIDNDSTIIEDDATIDKDSTITDDETTIDDEIVDNNDDEIDSPENKDKKDKKDKKGKYDKNNKKKNGNSNKGKGNKSEKIKVYSSNNLIVCNNKNREKCRVQVFNIQTARVVKEFYISGNSTSNTEVNSRKGPHSVVITTNNGIEKTTVMLK